jgi:two-component system, OmpR family, response regulator
MDGAIVLVVDDDPSLRMLCRVNLELDGHDVLEAASLAEARQRLVESPVDVVLLDVHVGTEDGRKLLDEIRERGGARVALFTGSVGVDFEKPAGIDAVIPKPFSLEVLASTVERLAMGPTR